MLRSWELGRINGIQVTIHWSFLMLAAVIGSSALLSQGMLAAIGSVATLLAVFGCVVLHEFGHALAARRYGIGTHDITLYPIGGVARLERMPKDPWQELVVALAGPAVNVVIAAALFAGLRIAGQFGGVTTLGLLTAPFLIQLFWTNVALVVFNLLPAFPMDGGRVLRALLAMRLPYVQATTIAATTGQAMAVVFGVVGLLTMPMLMLVAVFVFVAARAEAEAVRQAHASDFGDRLGWPQTGFGYHHGHVGSHTTAAYRAPRWETASDGVVTIELPPRSRITQARVID